MNNYQLTWSGIMHDNQGYSTSARGYVFGLDSIGVDVKIKPLNYGTKPVKINKDEYVKLLELSRKPYNLDKKQILVVHVQPWGLNYKMERLRYEKVINQVVFEPEPIHNEWISIMNELDSIWVPSTHNKDIFVKSGIEKPIYIIPHGVDFSKFKPEGDKADLGLEDDYFVFLSIGTFSYRKAFPELLNAFWEEFSADDKVCLVIKTHSMAGETGEELLNRIKKYKAEMTKGKLIAPVIFQFDQITNEELNTLYRACDCYVLPTRGEGVGLPYMEAMACGKPCIATNWGGQTDFITNENGLLLNYNMKPVDMKVPDCRQYFKEYMRLAEPDLSHLKELMRYAYNHREEMKQKGKRAYNDIQKWTWENSAKKIVEALSEIL